MQFQIKNRWTSADVFECELSAEIAGQEYRFQLGFAVKKAIAAGANLAGANLADANLAGAKWRDNITINLQPLQLHGLPWPVMILDTHMQIGCELHSLADWAAFDNHRIAQMNGRDALKFWRAYKDTLLALAAADGRGTPNNLPD